LYSASLHKLKGCSNGVPVHTGMHCAPSALLLARTDFWAPFRLLLQGMPWVAQGTTPDVLHNN